ncbi:hypothetical protein N7492_007184 [Penicillium capsulatum]|uniref:Alcohol dehydrogenase-like N-terminal domain-containing protein n=1 Tax=Penicillium capsulatum TaxID=69766 RepID=A0A9W9LKI9_9EURO|nr:hypothetical protein N7492_007184 [Penicillium capsulatum]
MVGPMWLLLLFSGTHIWLEQCFDINAFGDGAVLGCDFVGEVTELGSGVTGLAKGDITAGLIWGDLGSPNNRGILRPGAYSEYTIADERISFKLSANISRAHASTVPLAAATAWLASFSLGCLNLDRSAPAEPSISSTTMIPG